MPSDPVSMTVDHFVLRQLDERLAAIETEFDADALCIVGQLVEGIDDAIRLLVEDLRSRRSENSPQEGAEPRDRLVVLITTQGGYSETVSRIVDTMRHHYSHVIFVVPNHAYSAGTVLAMSGDEIWMDYYSRLGPIDPQVENAETGKLVPANGYLTRYNRLIAKAKAGTITEAETAILINSFN